MHYSLLYISRFAPPITTKTLDEIRTQSAILNEAADVSGLLLSTPGYFCQFLQGSSANVEQTMARISRDPRHKEIAVLLKTDIPELLFPGWAMATSLIPEGDIAREIELAYRDKLADLSAVDRLMSIMQRFQPLDGINNPTVTIDSETDKKLGLTKLATQDNSIQGLLELGESMFSDCDIALAIREPGDNGYGYRANITTDSDPIAQFLNHLPNEHFSNTAKFCHVENTGTVQWSPTAPIKKPDSLTTPFIHSAYKSAVGIAVTDSEHELIGNLWLLRRVDSEPDNTIDKDMLSRLARSIGEQIELRSTIFLTNLRQQNSQRQQLNIAAKLRRLEAVVNVASSAILALDRNGRVLMINDSARKIFNLHSQKAPFDWPNPTGFLDPGTLLPIHTKNSPLHHANASADASADAELKNKHRLANKLFAFKRTNSDQPYFLRVKITEVNEADSAIWSVLVFDDVTALESSRERIRRSDRLEALGQLTGGIAHDFNNLLATILSSVELAKTENDPTQKNHLHDIAIASVHRGEALTNRLITFAIANPTAVAVHRLTDVMHSLLDLAESSIAEDIDLTIAPVSPSIVVKCDGGQLENALLNILINSRDAIRDSGTGNRVHIEVNVLTPGNTELQHNKAVAKRARVEIVISDDGPGMSEEVIQRATDPFYSTKRDNAGSGLGLSMVYGFVQQSGGELQIKNLNDAEDLLTGTQVTLILEHANEAPAAPREATPESVSKHQPANILLVEDEPELAQVLKLSLQRVGHSVQMAHSAGDAIKILQSSSSLDLLLTDIVLPGSIDGYSLAKEAVTIRPELRVLYLSGYTRNQPDASLLGPVLTKPVSAQQLMLAIKKELERSADLPMIDR